jgi:glutaryl-CoA dehydrogenase (non-decarboxylating)
VDFQLTQEHLMAQQMVRNFAHKEVYPTVKEWDRKQAMSPAVLPRMGELGILGICIPTRYGGQGFDYITLGLACEELERVDSTLRVVMSVHVGLNSLGLLQWGTEEQKERFLTPQARGQKIAAFCLTEPGAGSDVANIQASARRTGDKYVLNGEKMWISLSTKADHFLVIAKTDPNGGARGMTAFIVTSDMPGLSTGDLHGKLGMRAGSTGWVLLQDVEVPLANRLGEEGEGFYVAMSSLDNGRFTVAAGAVGLIRACLEDSIKYAQSRSTFGKPIMQHQLIQQKIAFMQQWYDAGRLLYLRSGWLKNQGVRNTRETSMAKWFATDHSVHAALEAIQVHGAYGFSDEYDVERYLRNSKGATLYEGTSEIHQLMQASYALGLREDHPLRCELPAYDTTYWQTEPVGA